jgi:hypothetical protein
MDESVPKYTRHHMDIRFSKPWTRYKRCGLLVPAKKGYELMKNVHTRMNKGYMPMKKGYELVKNGYGLVRRVHAFVKKSYVSVRKGYGLNKRV